MAMICDRGRCLEGTEAAVRRTTSYALWLWAHVSPFTTRFPHVGVLVVGMPKEIYQVSTQDRGGSGIAAAVCSLRCASPRAFRSTEAAFFSLFVAQISVYYDTVIEPWINGSSQYLL